MGENEADKQGETILLVEDEEIVQRLLTKVLEMDGYRVLRACNSDEACKLSTEYGQSIDLLLTDVKLEEGLNGCGLARQLRRLRPDLRVLYISGYPFELTREPEGDIIEMETRELLAGFLYKPFHPKELTAKVRDILDAELW